MAAASTWYLNYFTLPNNERYYDFVRGPVHFFASTAIRQRAGRHSTSSTQGLWLQNGLQNSTSRWTSSIFITRPSRPAPHGNSAWMQWPFKDWGADAVLAGHVHNYERLDKNGLPYFVNGSGGHGLYGWLPTLEPGSAARYNANYGAMLIEANDFSLSIKFYSIDVHRHATGFVHAHGFLSGLRFTLHAGFHHRQLHRLVRWRRWAGGDGGNGVAGSVGLAADDAIFHWTAHPFNWNAADCRASRCRWTTGRMPRCVRR